MKKVLISIILFLIVVVLAASFIIPKYVLNMITNYDPLTFNEVLMYDSMREDFGINLCNTPEDYGYHSETLTFKSLDESIGLEGWYVPCQISTDKCIILVHGRWSNRLKTMKYLALVDSLGLDTLYNVFVPDLRNSGNSDPGKTYMGYKFAEDLASAIIALAKQKQQNTFTLYGFSQGGMATMILAGRQDLQQLLSENNVKIDRMILDSPLSNVQETLWMEAGKMGLPKIIFNLTFRKFSNQIDGYGYQLRMSELLKNVTAPVLVLQSEDDKTTPISILLKEINGLNSKNNLSFVYFRGPDHVRIWQDDRTKSKYLVACKQFFYPELQ